MSTSWLEKFKQKNCLTGSLSRKGSVDIKNGNGGDSLSHDNSVAQTPSPLSPVTAGSTTTPSPLSPKQDQDGVKMESTGNTPKLESHEFSPSLSQHVKTLSDSPIFTSENPFVSSQDNGASPLKRARSRTLPILTGETGPVSNASSRHVSPKASPTIDEELQSPTSGSMVMKRNNSSPDINTSMQPHPLPNSTTMSPVSSPGSPTQDEARKALELVMNYFQNQPSGLAAQDFFTIGKLMEKLELAQTQAAAAATATTVQPASLQRIEEYPDHPRVCKKRSIHTL